MKKLLLSSAVMLFLCSNSFAQQQKQVSSLKLKQNVLLNTAQQVELDKKKVVEYEASQKNMTPERKIQQEAQKMQAQIKEKEKNLAIKNSQKADIDPRASRGQ